MNTDISQRPYIGGRNIVLGPDLAPIPERLLLAHAGGEVLFIVGAGVSRDAGLPDFRKLAVEVYEDLDSAVHSVISRISSADDNCEEQIYQNCRTFKRPRLGDSKSANTM